jgi:glycosyltransferase involved in cell wall biosynthesis
MIKRKIGLYLGVSPSAGGMFQYAQCMVDALIDMRSDSLEIVVVYGDSAWMDVLSHKSVFGIPLKNWRHGENLAKLFMVFPIGLGRKLATLFNPLVSEILSLECDLWIFPAQDVFAWQINTPVLSTIHDLMHRYERRFAEAGSWWRYILREHRFKKLANVSLGLLVDSEIGKEHVIESYGVPSERIFSLPYIAPSYLNIREVSPDFDGKYSLPKKFYFYPAQFWPHKNHQLLLDALVSSRKLCPDMHLVLSGGFGHDFHIVKAYAYTLGVEDAVHFVGYIPDADLSGFYMRARGLVMPTFFGPTNIPPLEAMSTGCPILISRVYGMPEQCGDAALYFSPNSPGEMSDLMVRLWNDDVLYSRLVEAGKLKNACWGQTQFNECFAEILKRLPIK